MKSQKVKIFLFSLLIASLGGYAQQNTITLYPDSTVSTKITISPPTNWEKWEKGEGKTIKDRPITLRWDRNENDVIITFVAADQYNDASICFFPQNTTFKQIKKDYNLVWFSKLIRKETTDKKVKGCQNCPEKKGIYNLNPEIVIDVPLQAQESQEIKITVYIASTKFKNKVFSDRYKKIEYSYDIIFNVILDTCNNDRLRRLIEEYQRASTNIAKKTDSIKQVKNRMIGMACKEVKNLGTMATETSPLPLGSNNNCPSLKTAVNNYSKMFSSLNDSITAYNKALETKKQGCVRPTPQSPSCDCDLLARTIEKLGDLYMDIQLAKQTKTSLQSQYREITNDINRMKNCSKCEGYASFQQICNKIEKSLK